MSIIKGGSATCYANTAVNGRKIVGDSSTGSHHSRSQSSVAVGISCLPLGIITTEMFLSLTYKNEMLERHFAGFDLVLKCTDEGMRRK